MTLNNHSQSDQGESIQQQSQPTLCLKNCGFFANPACGGLCSKCYRDQLQEQQQQQAKGSAESQVQSGLAKASTPLQAEPPNPTAVVCPEPASMSQSQMAQSSLSQASCVPSRNLNHIPNNQEKLSHVGQMNAGFSLSVEVPGLPTSVPGNSAQPTTVVQDPLPSSSISSSRKPNRCTVCNKKVGLTGFSCRCGQLFCGSHRLAEAHQCTFDYKSRDRQKLAENNPVVIAPKVQKL